MKSGNQTVHCDIHMLKCGDQWSSGEKKRENEKPLKSGSCDFMVDLLLWPRKRTAFIILANIYFDLPNRSRFSPHRETSRFFLFCSYMAVFSIKISLSLCENHQTAAQKLALSFKVYYSWNNLDGYFSLKAGNFKKKSSSIQKDMETKTSGNLD